LSKQEYILFIFEGKDTEPIIFKNIKKHFLHKKETNISQDIVICYGTAIYRLYEEFLIDGEIDDDLDLVTILKPKNEAGEIIHTNQVSTRYLFFDYDSHAHHACDTKLLNMLNLFNDEYDKGKLFVSYPMVEAIKHLKDSVDFKNTIVESIGSYKGLVSQSSNNNLQHIEKLTYVDWIFIIDENSKKANFIVKDVFKFPEHIIEQLEIFDNQKSKFIDKENKVAVLSSFPVFLLDYYGLDVFKKRIKL